MYNITERTSKV